MHQLFKLSTTWHNLIHGLFLYEYTIILPYNIFIKLLCTFMNWILNVN